MRSWIFASLVSLFISFVASITSDEWFTAYEFFTSTSLFAIYLEMKREF